MPTKSMPKEKCAVETAHSRRLRAHLRDIFGSYQRIDRISVRAKSVDRFVAKAEKEIEGKRKYDDPLTQIQDQLGARIVTFYKSDVEKLTAEVAKYFRHIESLQIVPESESEFGYEGMHFVLFLPRDIFDDEIKESESIVSVRGTHLLGAEDL